MPKECIGLNTDSWFSFAKELQLPIGRKYCGLRQLADRRYAQFIGVLAQNISQLFDRKDENRNEVLERLSITRLVEMVGEDAFELQIRSLENLVRFREYHHCLSKRITTCLESFRILI